LKKAILLIGIGVAMVVFDLTLKPVFSIPVTDGFSFPVGLLAVLVGLLYWLSARIALKNADLTPGELDKWGKPLEMATPRIIELSEQQWSTGAIVKQVEKEEGIPQTIVVKYMFAMRKYLADVRADSKAKERRQL